MGPPPDVAAVRSAVRRSLAGLPSEALVLVACSGGADSLALAGATAFVAPRMGLRAGGITIDHGLQHGSEAQADAVVAAFQKLGLVPALRERVRVARDGGPEAAARTARYGALSHAVREQGAAAVLLGHTSDDQAETVLLGLARGSGARSLAGMAPRVGHYLRPLLGTDRATVHGAATSMGLTAWSDPHNTDPAYARSRVRAQALPTLERVLGPGVADALARTAGLLRDDADALEQWAERAAQDATDADATLDAGALTELPRAIRTRVLRAAAIAAGCPAGALSAVHIAELDRLVTDWRGQAHVDLPGGRRGRRRAGRVAVTAD